MKKMSALQLSLGLGAALVLAACGGGGAGGTTATAAQSAAVSSGTVTAIGSVFVNGHEFNTANATVVDDDSGTASGVAVGMTVDVIPASASTASAPLAREIHVHALARGTVDSSDTTSGTLSVMGQSVVLSPSTAVLDVRSCTTATTSPCTPITTQAALQTSCTLSGSTYSCANQSGASFVQVFGFLANSTSGSTSNPIIQASLVRVIDPGTTPIYKAEGPLSAIAATEPRFTVGKLQITGTSACGASGSCNFSTNQVVAAVGSSAPTLTGGSSITLAFTPAALLAHPHANVLTSGSSVELEGKVSAPAATSFILQGLTVKLPATLTVPAAGDVVEVSGTVNADLSIAATAIKLERSAAQLSAPFVLSDVLPAGSITGTAPTYSLALLGTTVTVNANTRIQDLTAARNPAAFNINNFATYVGALTSPSVVINGYIDPGSQALVATYFGIIPSPATPSVVVGGPVTADSSGLLTIAGVTVNASSASFNYVGHAPNGSTLPSNVATIQLATASTAADVVTAQGTETSPAGGSKVTAVSVVDFGPHIGEHGAD